MDSATLIFISIVGLLVTPGPTNTLLATSGAAVGFSRSATLLLGELAGYVTAILSIRYVFGLIVIDAYPAALRIACCVYLLYLAVKLWRISFRLGTAVISLRRVFVTTVLNPKGAIFALVILPFGSQHDLLYFMAFVAIVPTIGALWILIGTHLGRGILSQFTHYVPRFASVALGGFAALLVASTF